MVSHHARSGERPRSLLPQPLSVPLVLLVLVLVLVLGVVGVANRLAHAVIAKQPVAVGVKEAIRMPAAHVCEVHRPYVRHTCLVQLA